MSGSALLTSARTYAKCACLTKIAHAKLILDSVWPASPPNRTCQDAFMTLNIVWNMRFLQQ